MKIYIQDLGVYGCIVVIADSQSMALSLMSEYANFNVTVPIQEYNASIGFSYANLGDS